MAIFVRYIGIDYSGAATPTASLTGLRIYMAERHGVPVEVNPPPSRRKYWTRRGIAEWLVERLAEGTPTLVGIDHGFSFPLCYFEAHALEHNWPAFLNDFRQHWPTDEDHTWVELVREGMTGKGAARTGNTRWRRLTENGRVAPNRCFISTCRARWRNPRTLEFLGCSSFAFVVVIACISGHLTDGTSLRGAPSSPRSIHRYGAAPLRTKVAPSTSTTPSASLPSWRAPIARVRSVDS